MCAQEAGGAVEGCTTGARIPTFAATKEVASASVEDGVITLTLATGLGDGVDGETLTFTPTINTEAFKWTSSHTVTNHEVATLITRNNPPAAPSVP